MILDIIKNIVLDNLGEIITLVLSFGGILMVAKKFLKEVKDVLDVVVDALADNKISNTEIARIVKEAKDIKNIVVDLKK